ncbi:MAG: DMT family transporter [Hyphomicrobiaceae bacterium]
MSIAGRSRTSVRAWRLAPQETGILLFVGALTIGAGQGAVAKYLSGEMPVPLILWWRYAVTFAVMVPIALARNGRSVLVPERTLLNVVRGLLLVVASIGHVFAVKGMPLADALAIVFVYPFIVTALAPVVLGERVRLASWIAVATGFVGVMVVIRPGFHTVDVHALMALVAGFSFAMTLLVTRRLSVGSPATVTATWTAGTGAAVLTLALPFVWQAPTGFEVGLLVLIGALAAAGQLGSIIACNKTDMAVLAPFGYSEMISATVMGWIVFGDFPDAVTWTGIAIIVMSGIYIATRTRARRPA